MKKLLTVTLVSLLVGSGIGTLEAIPAFARQINGECKTCHFQHYPILNAYGRAFKAGGFTQSTQELIEGEGLSLSPVLNASLFAKVRYQKTNGVDNVGQINDGSVYDVTQRSTGTNGGEVQYPDEFAFLLGGRIGENVGMMTEVALPGPAGVAGFKMPIMFDLAGGKVGVVPFITDNLGSGYGFELFNTGNARNVRVMEHRTDTSAQQFVGVDGAATGFAFVYYTDMFHVALTKWSPEFASTTEPNANLLRVGITPGSMGGFDVGIGFSNWFGTTKIDDGTGHEMTVEPKAMAADLQLQGEAAGMPVGVYVTWAKTTGTERNLRFVDAGGGALGTTMMSGPENTFNANRRDEMATALLLEVGLTPSLTVSVGMRTGDNGSNATGESDATANMAVFLVNAMSQGLISPAVFAGVDPAMLPILTGILQGIEAPDLCAAGEGCIFAGPRNKDNSYTIGAAYSLYQNLRFHVEHSARSGNKYEDNGRKSATLVNGKVVPASGQWADGGSGDHLTTFMISAGM
jgi:hypothetical protein